MRRNLTISSLVLTLIVATTLLAPAPSSAQTAAESLLTHIGPTPGPHDATVARENVVELRHNLLETATALDIPLFEGLAGRFQRTDLERRGAGDLVWRGRLVGSEGQATLTLKHDLVVGLVHAYDHAYELSVDPDGRPLLRQLDQDEFAPCAHEDHSDPARGLPPMPESLRRGEASSPRGETVNVDLLTLYTPQARDAAGGVAAIEATIQAAVDNTNTAAINSNAVVRFTLLGTELANYNDTGDIFTDRNWVQADPTVNALRDQYGADLVGLIVNTSGFCGVAFLMGNEDPAAFAPFGYQVTVRGCAVGNLSFAHEHGHNIGLQHDPANGASPANATYAWSYGHNHNASYRTVMSYSNQCPSGCTRVTQFSNPDVLFNGLPTGIADQRHNQRTIGLIVPFTAEYRSSELPIFSDGFESGDTTGWDP